MGIRRTVGLVGLITALASPVAAQQVKVASVTPPAYHTIDSSVSALKQPDQALYDAIGKLDPKKAEELNTQRQSDDVLQLLEERLEFIRKYDVVPLDRESRAKIAWAANEVGTVYLRRKEPQHALVLCMYAKDIADDARVHGYEPNVININIAVAAFNSGAYTTAIKSAQTYLEGQVIEAKKAETAKIIIVNAEQRLDGK